MKIYNKKYLFIGVLASLVTACGSGGGGGGSNSPSTSVPSPPTASKPSTEVVSPVKPEGNIEKPEAKPEVKPVVPPAVHSVPKVDKPDNAGSNPNPPVEENPAPVPQPEEPSLPVEGPTVKNSEVLEKIGLGAPQITYLMKKLKDKGFDVSTDIFTVDAAKEEIMKFLKKEGL